MEKVNYITQLNEALECFNRDIRIKQGHITLYLAFFHKWNREFFKNTIMINREIIMERAKIKSKTTYHNYLRDLNDWDYLQYLPSYHPACGSRVKMTIFGTSTGSSSETTSVQNLANSVPEPRQNMVSFYKQKTFKNKNKKARPFNILEVLLFFKTNDWTADEGKKYYDYYQERNWEISKGVEIKDWKIAARNFVEKGREIERRNTMPIIGYPSKRYKDYGQPL